jgi:chromosomal replication initiation ATPase DnaA
MEAKQLPLDLRFRPSYGRDDFLVTGSNREAVAMIDAWPRSWGGFPALTLYGPGGSGKSHLASVWTRMTDAKILSPDTFADAAAEELAGQTGSLVIERLDLLTGDEEGERKLFHLYNTAKAAEKFILLTSHLSPARMEFSLRDLESRLRASPAVEIHQPDDDLLCHVFAKQLHDRGLVITERLVRYAVGRMERSWGTMERIVTELATRATAEKKGITFPLVRDILLSQAESP